MAGFWAALFGAVGVIAGAVVTYLLGRRKARADAATELGTAAATIAAEGSKQLQRMGLWLRDAEARAVEHRKLADASMRETDHLRVEFLTVRARLREVEHMVRELRAQLAYEREMSQARVAQLVTDRRRDQDLFRTELVRLRAVLGHQHQVLVDDMLQHLVGMESGNGQPDTFTADGRV